MIEQMTYTNGAGDIVNFGVGGIRVSENEIINQEWSYTLEGKVVTEFDRKSRENELTVTLVSSSDIEGQAKYDAMIRAFEYDIHDMQPGSLEINGYSTACYIYAVEKPNTGAGWSFVDFTLKLLLTNPVWVKATEFEFSTSSAASGGVDFPFDLMFDLLSATPASHFVNESQFASDFRLQIFSGSASPAVVIGGTEYQVNVTIPSGGYIVIDSRTKTIEQYTPVGVMSNAYKYRQRGAIGSGSYVFEKIAPGLNNVTWNNLFAFIVTVFDARSEPPLWT